jgi:hypothetical protein
MFLTLEAFDRTENLVMDAFFKAFRFYAKNYRSSSFPYQALSDLKIWSRICLASDYDYLHPYFGRHFHNDKVFVRSNSVYGVLMPITCSFTSSGCITLHDDCLQPTIKNASYRHANQRFFIDAADDLGFSYSLN